MKAAVEWFALFKSLSPHLALALEWLLKTSFLFGIALLVATLLRNRSARARCWIWRLLFATVAVLLFAEWSPWVVDRFRPRVAVSPDAAVRTDFQHQAETFWILRPQQERDELRSRRQTEFLESMPEGRPPWEATPFFQTMDDFRTAWLNRLEKAIPWIGGLGAAWALLVLALRSFLGLRWLRKGAMPAGKTIVEAAREACIQLHVRRTPEIRVSSKLATPLLSGFFRPVIHLPAMTAEWERSKLLDVLFHELAHWKRHDFLWLQAGRVLTALFWWNPCLRHALRRMNEAAEEAADDQVLLSRRPADAYARTLVEIAAGANLSGKAAGLPMIGYRSLERRIKSLMAENRWRGKLGKQAIVMIAATFLIGSLAASVRIGMASPALRAAPSAPALLTPKQRELAKQIIASTKKRMEAFRRTHVKLESRFVEEEGAKRIISPMPAQMEAWWDSWTSRYRVQYTPRVVRRLHGASDFSISDETTVCDGRSVYNWKEGRPMTENPVSPDRFLHPDYLNLHDGSYLIRMLSMILHYGSLQPGVVEYAITETQWEGEEAVKIVETFTSDDKIQQQRTIVVTAGENDLIRFSETLFPQEPNGNFTRKTINQVAKAANGEFYATHYTTASSIRKTITTTQYTVLSLEPLAELPAAVFHLPTTGPVAAISEKLWSPARTSKRQPSGSSANEPGGRRS